MTAPTYHTIRKARTARLNVEPFDPHEHALMSHTPDGLPGGFLTLPDLGKAQMLAMREGMDLLARLHDDDLVEEWIGDILTLAQDPETVGLLMVNVIRGIAPVLAVRMGTDTREDARELYRSFAFDAWMKNFDEEEVA